MKAQTIQTIKATVPVLQQHGEALTQLFYRNLFSNNPEVAEFFNPAHQVAGTQQKALAGAICAYAQHIDNPAMLGDAVSLIAHKHASLGIKPEHYPIVGENLLLSIRELLGEAATDEIIDAWAEAYEALANVFMEREAGLYAAHADQHGWTGFKPFRVARKVAESDIITSFYLEPADGQPLAAHQPGQYITIRHTLEDGSTTMRNYSLSDAPGKPYYRISVKRELSPEAGSPAGRVSSWLHDAVKTGSHVDIAPPSGEFTLNLPDDPQRTIVFIAGGVGITPLISMLHEALDKHPQRRLVLLQACRNGLVAPFSGELAQLQTEYDNFRWHLRLSEPTEQDRQRQRHDSEGLLDTDLLNELVGEQAADYYLCGPQAMLAYTYGLLKSRKVADSAIRYEFFGPALSLDS